MHCDWDQFIAFWQDATSHKNENRTQKKSSISSKRKNKTSEEKEVRGMIESVLPLFREFPTSRLEYIHLIFRTVPHL